MKHIISLAIFMIFASSVAMAEVTETEEFNFDLQEGGRISLGNINGDIHIDGVSGKQVQIIAIKKAGSQEYLDNLKIVIDATAEHIRIETRHPDSKNHWFHDNNDDSGSVSYALKVPLMSKLDTIDTVNGDVRIKGVLGTVSVETVNGRMVLEGLEGSANLDTVNGRIDAQFNRLGSGQRVAADTVNGKVVLRLPSTASAQVHAETLNGDIDADDFGLEPDKKFVGKDLKGKIGGGEARVDVDTVNGSVTIALKN